MNLVIFVQFISINKVIKLGKIHFLVVNLKCLTYLQILSVDNMKYGYNAASDRYEDLMAAKILDPTKVR